MQLRPMMMKPAPMMASTCQRFISRTNPLCGRRRRPRACSAGANVRADNIGLGGVEGKGSPDEDVEGSPASSAIGRNFSASVFEPKDSYCCLPMRPPQVRQRT